MPYSASIHFFSKCQFWKKYRLLKFGNILKKVTKMPEIDIWKEFKKIGKFHKERNLISLLWRPIAQAPITLGS